MQNHYQAWWRHQMETFSALLAICTGNSPVTGEFPAQRPVTRSLDVLFDLRLNKRLSKQWWSWWLWRHSNGAQYSAPPTNKHMPNWLFGARQLFKSVLGYCLLDPGNKFQWFFSQNIKLSFTKMLLQIPSARWRPFCPRGDELTRIGMVKSTTARSS